MNSIATFDLVVLGALLVGALIGIVVGLLRASLLALSWAGAAVVTVYAFPYIEPIVNDALKPPMLANAVGGGVLFLVALIVLHLLSYSISDRVRGGRMRLLDRTLGLMAGLALPALALSAAFLFARDAVPTEWLENSRTRPLVEQGAKWIDRMIPPEFKLPGVERTPSTELKDLGDALPPARQVLRPPIAGQAAGSPDAKRAP
jgi:membrane protein required for colicin V production